MMSEVLKTMQILLYQLQVVVIVFYI